MKAVQFHKSENFPELVEDTMFASIGHRPAQLIPRKVLHDQCIFLTNDESHSQWCKGVDAVDSGMLDSRKLSSL